jgi:hypothetical protein
MHARVLAMAGLLAVAPGGGALRAGAPPDQAPTEPASSSSTAVPPQSSPLDFAYYRTTVEPIFLKVRGPNEGAGRSCVSCHASAATRLRLQPTSPQTATWTEEQSRQNFLLASALVTPGQPLKSRLLLHPLAAAAGGDPTHNGGKFWQSQNDAEWQALAAWVNGGAAAGTAAAPPASLVGQPAAPALDFEFFRTEVQAIFLKRRPGHARCYACHALGAGEGGPMNVFRLQVLSPGATVWDEEQSRKNFEAVLQKVVPGNPLASRLLIHPLRYESGGDQWHGGGGQFSSANDPDWQVLAAWVMGKKASAGTER